MEWHLCRWLISMFYFPSRVSARWVSATILWMARFWQRIVLLWLSNFLHEVIGMNVKIVFVQRYIICKRLLSQSIIQNILGVCGPRPPPLSYGWDHSVPGFLVDYPLKCPILQVYYNKHTFSGFLKLKDFEIPGSVTNTWQTQYNLYRTVEN